MPFLRLCADGFCLVLGKSLSVLGADGILGAVHNICNTSCSEVPNIIVEFAPGSGHEFCVRLTAACRTQSCKSRVDVRLANHSLVRLAHHHIKQILVGHPRAAAGRRCFCFGHLEESVAPLAADPALARLGFERGNTDGRTVIVLSNADALQVFAVENIVLVVCPTAFLGFAKRAQVFRAGPGVCFGVDNCEVRCAR
jgi:hypothetical protein